MNQTPLIRHRVGTRYSEIAIFNHVVYLAGLVPENEQADIAEQTQNVLTQIDQRLKEANSHKSLILRAQIFLPNLIDMESMNQVWDAWVAPENAPPRATVQAALANSQWKIEIVVTAAQYTHQITT